MSMSTVGQGPDVAAPAAATVPGAATAAPPAPPAPPAPAAAPPPTAPTTASFEEAVGVAHALHANLSGVLLGTPAPVVTAVIAVLSGSHLLIEDVPGVGKTVLARAIARSLGSTLSRIQGHPDLLPSDVTGVSVFAQDTGTWEFRPGPVFAHIVLLDELNWTPPRTQSALLESMEERQVSVDGETWPLPTPHFVVATQNPIGQMGTFPLVESQLDRFGLATSVGYPDAETESRLVLHDGGRYALDTLAAVSSPAQWERAIRATAAVHVEPVVAQYAVALVRATRTAGTVRLGASPRAAISLIRSAQARSVLAGRPYVTPGDVQAVAVSCLAHRLVVDGDGSDAAGLVVDILRTVPVPVP